MKAGAQIQRDEMNQFKRNPLLTSSVIGVAAKIGVATLSGHVDTYLKKAEAEKEARRVSGVKAITEGFQGSVSPLYNRTDVEIAKTVLIALKCHASSIPEENILMKVVDGRGKWSGRSSASPPSVRSPACPAYAACWTT